MASSVRIAVEGCCHGELDNIYKAVEFIRDSRGVHIDMLICCGDFQVRVLQVATAQGACLCCAWVGLATARLLCAWLFAQSVRTEEDMECLACPPKYRAMHDFYKCVRTLPACDGLSRRSRPVASRLLLLLLLCRVCARYYTGEAVAPVLTLFIGGNHEASNYLRELHYGGWVAPNIYYMGSSGVVRFGGLRLGGVSGIFKAYDFNKPYHERPPYSESALKSVFHVRRHDFDRLGMLTPRMDVFLSHDWPQGVARYGNLNALFRAKKHLREEVLDDSLGCPPAAAVLHRLQPRFWFSAHLHVKYAALVRHAPALPGRAAAGGGGVVPLPRATAAVPARGPVSLPVRDECSIDIDDAPPAATVAAVRDECSIDIDDDGSDVLQLIPTVADAPSAVVAGVSACATAAATTSTSAAPSLATVVSAAAPAPAPAPSAASAPAPASATAPASAPASASASASAPASATATAPATAPAPTPLAPVSSAAGAAEGAVPATSQPEAYCPLTPLALPPLPPPVPHPDGRVTRFLALDKCLPHRQFLQVIDVPVDAGSAGVGTRQLCYDAEWLAIVRRTHGAMASGRSCGDMPPPSPSEVDDVNALLAARCEPLRGAAGEPCGLYAMPLTFAATVEAFDPRRPRGRPTPPVQRGNPQTDALLALLALQHVITVPFAPPSASATDPPS
jgi:hypothetical protein